MNPNGDERASAFARHLRSRRVLPAIVGVGAVCWVASGLCDVASDERGVVTRFGRYHATLLPGIHYTLPWPIDQLYSPRVTDVKRIEVGLRTKGQLWSEPRRSDVLTGDENILKIVMVVQYKIDDPARHLFRVEESNWLVERTVESAVNLCVASLPVDEILTTAKDEIQIEAVQIAQRLLQTYESGIRLLGGNLTLVDPPDPVMDSFKEVASAKKDSERLMDEARGYEGQLIPVARGEAQQMISRAQGLHADRLNRARGEASRFLSVLTEYRQAKGVTRTRVYVEAMERILSPMSVIILDGVKGKKASDVTIVDR